MRTRDKDELRVRRLPLGGAAHLNLAQTGPLGTSRRRHLPRVSVRSEGCGRRRDISGRESEICRGGRVCPLARMKPEAGSSEGRLGVGRGRVRRKPALCPGLGPAPRRTQSHQSIFKSGMLESNSSLVVVNTHS